MFNRSPSPKLGLLTYIFILIVILLVVIVILALLGPAVGNVVTGPLNNL